MTDAGSSSAVTFDVAVVGGGPAGLAAAWESARHGADVVVVEAGESLGGLARSFTLWGRRADVGCHILDDDLAGLEHLWSEVLEPGCHRVPLHRGVQVGHRVFDYPFRPSNVIRRLGVIDTVRAGVDAGLARLRAEPPANARDVIVGLYGQRLYDRLFRGFVRKYHGAEAAEVDAAFAHDLLGGADRPSLAATLRPGPSSRARASTFRYPDDGIGGICDRLGVILTDLDVQVRLRSEVSKIELTPSGFCVVAGAKSVHARQVISTMPAAATTSSLGGVNGVAAAASRSRNRSTVLVYLRVEGAGFSELWRYVADDDIMLGRVANLDRWWPEPPEKSTASPAVLLCEYWCDKGDAVWSASNQSIATLATDELLRLGLMRGAVLDSHIVRVNNSHGVARLGSAADQREIATFVKSKGVLAAGRGAGVGRGDVGGSLLSGILAGSAAMDRLDRCDRTCTSEGELDE